MKYWKLGALALLTITIGSAVMLSNPNGKDETTPNAVRVNSSMTENFDLSFVDYLKDDIDFSNLREVDAVVEFLDDSSLFSVFSEGNRRDFNSEVLYQQYKNDEIDTYLVDVSYGNISRRVLVPNGEYTAEDYLHVYDLFFN